MKSQRFPFSSLSHASVTAMSLKSTLIRLATAPLSHRINQIKFTDLKNFIVFFVQESGGENDIIEM